MSKKNKKTEKMFEDKKGVEVVQNQLLESYQNGVVEDRLDNNKNIYTFNNQSK